MYPEYHTSLDDFSVVSEKGLRESIEIYKKVIDVLETNCIPEINVLCEPQLGRRGLYPTISTSESGNSMRDFMNFISFCDGKNSLLEISNIINLDYFKCLDFKSKLDDVGLLKK